MNGVFRLGTPPAHAMPSLDGRRLGDKATLLAEVGRVLDFPDYYGGNWDALEECLSDLSWHAGPLRLLITHADALADDQRNYLIEIFLQTARAWAAEGRDFALYLA